MTVPWPVVYIQHMTTLQTYEVKGHKYHRLVTCKRINGKPTPVILAYLGSADDLLERLSASDEARVRSWSHGAVAAIYALAQELKVAEVIDRHLAKAGRRVRPASAQRSGPLAPQVNDGLTVGQTLALAMIGRACKPTSKRGFARWAKKTTLGSLANVDVDRLTSQHFWDQMDQLPVELIERIEGEVVADVAQRFQLPLTTLLYDATNFFTFIASTNGRCTLPARGKQKQKRSDLRQIGVALLCSHEGGIPLWHRTYRGNLADAKCFAEVLGSVRERLIAIHRDVESMTIVYDKGNVSRANQRLVDEPVDGAKLHYVASLTVASQRALVDEANPRLTEVELAPGETTRAYLTRRETWGAMRTLVVVVSERLLEGQRQGILQHVEKAGKWLAELAETLRRGKQKRDRARIQRDIENYLKGRQHLRDVMRVSLSGEGRNLALDYQFDQAALDSLCERTLGRLVLMTDRHDWSAAEIIRAYHGQARIEAAFAHLKNPFHVSIQPQFHWTDQKLAVHVFICVFAYLLASVLFLKAQRAGAPYRSIEALLDALSGVRRSMLVRRALGRSGKRAARITYQLEEIEPEVAPLLPVLGVTA